QDAVTDVTVLADHVGPLVVNVVVAVLPVAGRTNIIPLPGRGVDFRITHPVPLAVHDVMADLHVLKDLGNTQQRRTGQPGRRQDAGKQQAAAADFQPALGLDHAADITRILFAQAVDDAAAYGVDLGAELLQLFIA